MATPASRTRRFFARIAQMLEQRQRQAAAGAVAADDDFFRGDALFAQMKTTPQSRRRKPPGRGFPGPAGSQSPEYATRRRGRPP